MGGFLFYRDSFLFYRDSLFYGDSNAGYQIFLRGWYFTGVGCISSGGILRGWYFKRDKQVGKLFFCYLKGCV